MTVEQSRTIWEKLGAAEGLWASILLTIQLYILLGTKANPASSDAEFVAALQAERWAWEWMTFLRLVAGLMIIWWMGSLAGRLRLAEGEPGRLATIAFGVGTVWGVVWLVSAFLNSATILLAFDYANPAGARMVGALAIESAYVLTPSIVLVLTLATALVGLRYGGFPRTYAWATLGASGIITVLAILDWYGSAPLSLTIMVISLAWMATTSGLLIQTFRARDPVLGAQGTAMPP